MNCERNASDSWSKLNNLLASFVHFREKESAAVSISQLKTELDVTVQNLLKAKKKIHRMIAKKREKDAKCAAMKNDAEVDQKFDPVERRRPEISSEKIFTTDDTSLGPNSLEVVEVLHQPIESEVHPSCHKRSRYVESS